MADAKEIQKQDAPQLYNVVEEMSLAAGMPMPRVMILETEAMNAFATGTKPTHGTIVVTRGLLEKLNRDELQGVVAHEMCHLANLDTRYMVVVGVTVGLIALVCDMVLRMMQWGSFAGGRRDDDRKRRRRGRHHRHRRADRGRRSWRRSRPGRCRWRCRASANIWPTRPRSSSPAIPTG